MKSTWFANRRRYEFAKCLRDADYSMHLYELMRLFLQASYGAMKQASNLAAGHGMDEAIEQTVIDAQMRVKHKQRLAECLGVLVMGLEEEPHDFLGTVISELDQNDSKFKGQCFTPDSLCRLMSSVTIGHEKPNDERRLMLNEPACGGGAMVIAAAETLKGNGFMPWHYHWTCVDVDWRMFAVTFIQLNLLGIPAHVIHGNTLSLEQWDSAVTIVSMLHPPRKRDWESREAFMGDQESGDQEPGASKPKAPKPEPQKLAIQAPKKPAQKKRAEKPQDKLPKGRSQAMLFD